MSRPFLNTANFERQGPDQAQKLEIHTLCRVPRSNVQSQKEDVRETEKFLHPDKPLRRCNNPN